MKKYSKKIWVDSYRESSTSCHVLDISKKNQYSFIKKLLHISFSQSAIVLLNYWEKSKKKSINNKYWQQVIWYIGKVNCDFLIGHDHDSIELFIGLSNIYICTNHLPIYTYRLYIEKSWYIYILVNFGWLKE